MAALYLFFFSLNAPGAPAPCPSIATVIKQFDQKLQQIPREELIPKALLKRWKSAIKIKFPLKNKELVGKVEIFDIFFLHKLSSHNILAQRGLPIGQMTFRNRTVMIEGVVEIGGEAKEVILSVKGRKYWVELEYPESIGAKALTVGDYRNAPVKGIEFRGDTIKWEDANSEMKAWLNGPEAPGMRVRLGESGIFTRVDDQRFLKLGPSWKDEETGLTWSMAAEKKMDYAHAIKFCKELGGTLPTDVMYKALAKNNGHKIFRDNNNKYWWASPHQSMSSDHTILFKSDRGIIYDSGPNSEEFVRCVAK